VSPETYTRLKLQVVYRLISLAGQSPNGDDKASKDGQLLIRNFTALVGSSTLLYLTKHNGRGDRRQSGSPTTNPENLAYYMDAFKKDRPTCLFNFS